MLPRSIQARLLGLVLATVTALIGFGLWNQWQHDQARAIESAINEARLLAAQVDDHIGELELLLAGLSRSVSPNAADREANIRLLHDVKTELPPSSATSRSIHSTVRTSDPRATPGGNVLRSPTAGTSRRYWPASVLRSAT